MDEVGIDRKLVILGCTDTGKTSLTIRYCHNSFATPTAATIGASFLQKRISIDRHKMTLQIWDTAGQERFRSMAPMYYRNAKAAILVFDVTKEDTFEKIKGWLSELRKHVDDDIVLAVVGNKCDLPTSFNFGLAEAFGREIGATVHRTSAQSGQGVTEMFETVSRALLKKHMDNERLAPAPSKSAPTPDPLVRLGESTTPPPKQSGGCCNSTLLLCTQSVTIPRAVSKSMEEGAAAHPGRNEVLVDGLTFSSNFDSGNLLSVDRGRALDSGRCEYVVTAAPDASKPDTPPEAPITPTTWFHFSISGAVAGQEIALQIVNLIKHTALYDQDMRPVVRSLPSQKKWERLRQGVTYQADRQTNEFSIRFTYTVAAAGETVFFAFCYPYSYTDGQRMLRRLDQDFARRERTASSIYYNRETLVHSLDGRKVDLLTISSYDNILDNREETIPGLFPDHPHTPRPFEFQNKRVIFLTSRVHPAETPSSFVLDGALSFLLKRDDPRAHKLLKECVFKVIPMLNPDGVARGHYRLDSLGANLNRHYISPTMDKHPTIFAAKAVILATCHTMSKLALHVDLHAHAAKRGCFIYGNRYATATEQALSQVYPKLIGLNSVHFEYDQCNFTEQNMHLVEKRDHGLSKDGCARVALHRETSGIPVYFYTLECNFNMGRRPGSIPHSGSGLMSTAPLSPEVPRKAYIPKYTTASWEDVGKGMMVAVLDWLGTNEWSRIPHSQWRTMTGFIQDIKNQVVPSFDQHKETNKSSVKKNKQQERLEKKRYGCVGLPPATKTTPRTSSRTSTRSSNNNNVAF